jgi:hypothetical protein
MNRIHNLRLISCFAAAAAGLAAALVALGATPALAVNYPLPIDPGTSARTGTPVVHTVIVGGTPGWQIALIAAGAALTAAIVAVLADRARMARKLHTTTA